MAGKVIGIDLGTTNSVVADQRRDAGSDVREGEVVDAEPVESSDR